MDYQMSRTLPNETPTRRLLAVWLPLMKTRAAGPAGYRGDSLR
jgi:hypothetical protein